MIIELSKAKVTIKDSMSWGDKEQINATLMRGAKIDGKATDAKDVGFSFDTDAMLESKYVTLEKLITKIEEGEKEIEFSRDWVNNLSIEDGDKLMDNIDKVAKKV